MKNLLLSSALSIASLVIAPSVFAGPGELLGNTKNECNTSSGSCPITPTKFSTKIYRVALCTSNPMPSTTLDWEGNGCVDVYNSTAGEETNNIFSATGVTLSAENISIPTAGSYTHIAALFDKDFKVGSHHKVYNAGDSTDPLGERYYSTSSGGAAVGTADQVQMISGEFNTFMPQIACENDAAFVQRSATTEGYGNFLEAGETFYGKILNSSYQIPTTGGGSIETQSAYCDGAKYLLSIVDKPTTVGSGTTGIHLKILAPIGLIRVNQGSGNGVVTGFTAHGSSMAVKVVPITASE